MSRENGFLQLRRGIWEHVRSGQMNVNDFAIYVYILSEADTRSGKWQGCAQSIASALRIPLSTVKYSLAKMDGKYIKRFMVLGQRTAYPILCQRYLASSGPHVGRMLDAINTTNPRELQWFPAEPLDSSSTHVLPDVGRQKRIENREERKDTPSARVPAPDSLQQETIEAGFQTFWESWPVKQAKSDARRAWGKIPLTEYAAILFQPRTLENFRPVEEGNYPARRYLAQRETMDG